MIQHLPRAAAFACLLFASKALAGTDTVLILHTNDLHDHIRPGYENLGGVPYVAGYVASVRAQRADTLLVDAGDVTEKGDMVALKTRGAVMYEAMGRIGYDAAVPGNHDVKPELEYLDQCNGMLGGKFVCANLLRDSAPRYAPSRIIEVDGVKVGVIGITRASKRDEIPDFEFSKKVLAAEAAKLEPDAQLIVAVVHEGVSECVALSCAVPAVDVFVGGHKHEVVQEPRVVEETGALIVEAGSNARFVGELEVTVDLETEEIVKHSGRLVELRHEEVPCDTALAAWVRDREQTVCPEASRVIGHSGKSLSSAEAAYLIAAALKEEAGTDVGLCMADEVIRNGLPVGEIDVNAVFRVCAPWALEVVRTTATGAEVLDYLREFAFTVDRPQWAGFRAQLRPGNGGTRVVDTDLDAGREYSVALAKAEWDKRFSKSLAKSRGGEAEVNAADCPFQVLDALMEYVERQVASGVTPDVRVRELAKAARGVQAGRD